MPPIPTLPTPTILPQATTRTNVTCIRPRTRTITSRQVIAHKCQSRLCTLFNLLTTCMYLGIITRMAVVPVASLCTVWTILLVSVSLCVIVFPGALCYLVYGFLLCTSRCTYMARFLVVDGAMLGETRIVCECASVSSLRWPL